MGSKGYTVNFDQVTGFLHQEEGDSFGEKDVVKAIIIQVDKRRKKVDRKKRVRKPVRSSSRKRRRGAGKNRANPRSLVGTIGLFVGVVSLAAIGVGVVQEEAPESLDPVQDIVWNGARVRVDVQNGGGVTGMARSAMEILRPAGFDVVKFGNARAFDPERPSAVIDRVGRIDAARAIAKALGIDNVLSDPNPNLYVDVTVVVGSTWQPVDLARRSEITEPWPWWDPREWFGT